MSNTIDTFSNTVTQVPVMGLTSTITEEVNVGRDQFMSAYEDPLGAGWVFQVHLDVNAYLAGVSPPENESIAGIAMGDTRVSFDQVGAFEAALKANWATMTSVNTSQTGISNGVPLTEQVRLFLADFFDKNKELNAIVATNAADADASAIAYLDSAKITTQLTSFTQLAGTSSYEPALYADGTLGTTLGEFIASSGKPKDTTSLCANLLSVRQVVQVLEAYAALGVGGSNSRVIRVGGDYKYKLHEGDSIIGECTIVDSDAANVGSQYKTALPVKVQLVQTAFGAFDAAIDVSSVYVPPISNGFVAPLPDYIGTFTSTGSGSPFKLSKSTSHTMPSGDVLTNTTEYQLNLIDADSRVALLQDGVEKYSSTLAFADLQAAVSALSVMVPSSFEVTVIHNFTISTGITNKFGLMGSSWVDNQSLIAGKNYTFDPDPSAKTIFQTDSPTTIIVSNTGDFAPLSATFMITILDINMMS